MTGIVYACGREQHDGKATELNHIRTLYAMNDIHHKKQEACKESLHIATEHIVTNVEIISSIRFTRTKMLYVGKRK